MKTYKATTSMIGNIYNLALFLTLFFTLFLLLAFFILFLAFFITLFALLTLLPISAPPQSFIPDVAIVSIIFDWDIIKTISGKRIIITEIAAPIPALESPPSDIWLKA